MSQMSPEQAEKITGYYEAAFKKVGANVPKELITPNDDCSVTVEEATQPFLSRVLEDKDMIILRYEPGSLRVIDKTMRQFYTQVVVPIRRKEARS